MSDELEPDGEQEADGVPAETFDWGGELHEVPEEEEPDVLRFDIAGRSFAIFADRVAEVTTPLPITAVPGLPPYIRGVAVRRRTVVAVVELAHFLELQGVVAPEPARFLILETGGFEVAVPVTGVAGLELWPEDPESTTLMKNAEERLREFALGARWAPGGVVVLLDAARILELAAVR